MKKLLLHVAALAAFAPALCAQTLNITAPGYSAVKLFETNPGEVIAGVDFDTSGNVYYFLNSVSGSSILRRSAGDNYTAATTLFTFPTAVFGSFLRLDSGRLYFGDSSFGTIRVHDLGLATTSLLATVDGNYDIAFGTGGAFLSADPSFAANNEVFSLNLTTGVTTSKLISGDYSGPLAVDQSGQLYYGATGYTVGGNIYRYSAAEATGGGLTLDGAHLWATNAGNAFFAFDGVGTLFQSDFSTLNKYDTAGVSGTATPLGNSVDSIGSLAAKNGLLLATLTDYNGPGSADNQSAVFQVVPEPGSALLLLAGAVVLARRRSRR